MRICYQLQVKPERLDEYVERHRAVWPKVLRALERAGRRNYSIFVRDDGLLVGYYETDDDAASARALAEDPDTAEWEAGSAEFFLALPGNRPDRDAPHLTEVFNLEEQLSRVDGSDR